MVLQPQLGLNFISQGNADVPMNQAGKVRIICLPQNTTSNLMQALGELELFEFLSLRNSFSSVKWMLMRGLELQRLSRAIDE